MYHDNNFDIKIPLSSFIILIPLSSHTCHVLEEAPLYLVHEIYEVPGERDSAITWLRDGALVREKFREGRGEIWTARDEGRTVTGTRNVAVVPLNYRELAIVLQTLKFAVRETACRPRTTYPTLSHNLYSGVIFRCRRKLRGKFRVKPDGGAR